MASSCMIRGAISCSCKTGPHSYAQGLCRKTIREAQSADPAKRAHTATLKDCTERQSERRDQLLLQDGTHSCAQGLCRKTIKGFAHCF